MIFYVQRWNSKDYKKLSRILRSHSQESLHIMQQCVIYSKIIETCVHACTLVINIFLCVRISRDKGSRKNKPFENFRPHLFNDFPEKTTVACSIALISSRDRKQALETFWVLMPMPECLWRNRTLSNLTHRKHSESPKRGWVNRKKIEEEKETNRFWRWNLIFIFRSLTAKD